MAGRLFRRRAVLVFLLLAVIAAALYFLSVDTTRSGNHTAPPKGQPPPGKETEPPDNETRLPEETAGEKKDPYDYSKPVPAADVPLTEDYFADAVFIGDSRTRGLQTLSGPASAAYYTATGLMVDTLFTKEIIDSEDGGKIAVMDALRQTVFGKVYIMLGINELGWVYSSLFIDAYRDVLAAIREIEPAALIYIQSIIPVTAEKTKNDPIYNNENIREYNELLQQLAEEEKVYFLDVAGHLAGPDGCLPADVSTDGIHLKKKYCDLWRDYLFTHYIPQQ